MAWRIDNSVISGEIDNRIKGRVRGTIRVVLADGAGTVRLDLVGNAHPDVAGRLLTFRNPAPAVPCPQGFATDQAGQAGDITASRKVRVPDVPIEEFYLRKKRGESVPEHLANSLYLEWYSRANGRVVIETASFNMEISEAAWQPSPTDEDERREAVGRALQGFYDTLGEAIDAQEAQEPPDDQECDEHDSE